MLESSDTTTDIIEPTRNRHLSSGPLRAFGYGQFRIFWLSAFISQVSFAMMLVARGWLVLEMTDSPFLVTAANATTLLPPSLAAPFTGVMADRLNRRMVLIVGEVATFVTLLILALLALSDSLQVWHIFALSTLTGVAFALIMPTRPAAVPNLVTPQDLANAMALYTSLVSGSLFVGPAIAGYMIDTWNIGLTFLTASLLLIPAVALLFMLNLPTAIGASGNAPSGSVLANLSEGLGYVVRRPVLMGILLIAIVTATFGTPYMTLLPVVARDILRVGPDGLGMLGAATGIGMLMGAFTAACFSKSGQLKLLLLLGGIGIGPILMLFAISKIFVVSLVIAVSIGAVLQISMTSNITLVQMSAPDYIRGRVLGIRYVLMTSGPLGVLLLGVGAEILGPVIALILMGLLALVLIVIIALAIPGLRQFREVRGDSYAQV